MTYYNSYNEGMLCPNERIEMHQVRIESHYGQLIILEQCEGCGGIWFDESELFRAKQGEAEKIELLDSEILRIPTNVENPVLLCPRDQAELFRFDDRYFPKSIILERCPSCNGVWLNRGDFAKFQEARQELLRPKEMSPEDKKLEEEIKRILAMDRAGGSTETLGKLARFLSTPLDRSTFLPLEPIERQWEEENTVNSTLDVLISVLQSFIFR